MERMEGKSLSTGLAIGVAVLVGYELQRTIALPKADVAESILRANVQLECERMDDALERSKRDLQNLRTLASEKPSIASAIELVSAHAAMAGEIATLVKERITRDLVGVEQALDSVVCQTISRLTKIDTDYLCERETDVRDIGQRMMRHLMGLTSTTLADLPRDAIIVARELLPSDAIALANSGVVGVVTQVGGKLGHTAIIARSLGIPAVSAVSNVTQRIASGTNDLTQYLLAADRELSAECELVTAMHPAVLRAIQQVVISAKRWNCPVSVCGEEAGESEFAELLVGLGIRELSVSPSRVGELRAAIGNVDVAAARDLASRAQECRSPQEVRELFTSERRHELSGKQNNRLSNALGTCP